MYENKTITGSAVAALNREIKSRMEIVRILSDLEEQLEADRICGSWLSTENQLSAVIRRLGPGTWRAVIFDHTLCYKRVVQESIISRRRHKLWLGADDDNRIVYDTVSDTLTIGCYGRFIAEENIHGQEESYPPALEEM